MCGQVLEKHFEILFQQFNLHFFKLKHLLIHKFLAEAYLKRIKFYDKL